MDDMNAADRAALLPAQVSQAAYVLAASGHPDLADAVRDLRRAYDTAVDQIVLQARGHERYRDEMTKRLAAEREQFDRACSSMAAAQRLAAAAL